MSNVLSLQIYICECIEVNASEFENIRVLCTEQMYINRKKNKNKNLLEEVCERRKYIK
jgi:hypothetical protein